MVFYVMGAQGRDQRGPPLAVVRCRVTAPTGADIRGPATAPPLTELLLLYNQLHIILFAMFVLVG